MGYSPIANMRVKNFRNIGDITISFKDSPIITLVGENESGKTSLIKAFVVGSLNGYTTRQKKYIRQGTSGFGIGIDLEDGTSITRIKTKTFNSLSIEQPNGEKWEVNKIDRGEIPFELQAVMGLIEEPETKELIQVRTYENQLLFVVTADSTNYKVMYNALKIDQISKAIKIGTDEVNRLKREIDTNSVLCDGILAKIRDIRLVDIEPLQNMRDRVKQKLELLDKLEAIMRYKESVDSLRVKLNSIDRVIDSNIEVVNERILDKLQQVTYRLNLINSSKERLGEYSKLSKLKDIDVGLADTLESSIDKLNRVKELGVINRRYRLLGDVKAISDLSTLLYNICEKYNRVKDIEYSLGTYRDLSNTSSIHEGISYKIHRVFEIIEEKRKIEESGLLGEIESIRGIEDTALQKVSKVITSIKHRNTVISKYNEYIMLQSKIGELNQILKDSGAVVSTCPNCGEDVVVDIHKYDIERG